MKEETWLLAKKPIGNYQCASCESNLKDLEQKDNYIPWNKYPIREEKTYRIGHGYSRILEMVNEEVIKNYESKDNKGYASDDDKIIINSKALLLFILYILVTLGSSIFIG